MDTQAFVATLPDMKTAMMTSFNLLVCVVTSAMLTLMQGPQKAQFLDKASALSDDVTEANAVAKVVSVMHDKIHGAFLCQLQIG